MPAQKDDDEDMREFVQQQIAADAKIRASITAKRPREAMEISLNDMETLSPEMPHQRPRVFLGPPRR